MTVTKESLQISQPRKLLEEMKTKEELMFKLLLDSISAMGVIYIEE